MRELLYLGNGTSDHRIEIFQKTNPPKPEKTHLRSHFWPLQSGFSAIATYKTRIFSKPPNGPILKFFLVAGEVIVLSELLSDHLALFLFVGGGSGLLWIVSSAVLLNAVVYFCFWSTFDTNQGELMCK